MTIALPRSRVLSGQVSAGSLRINYARASVRYQLSVKRLLLSRVFLGTMSSQQPVDGVQDTYDSWPTQQAPSQTSLICRRFKLSWSFVSVVEILLMTAAIIVYFFLPKTYLNRMLPEDTKDHPQVNELAEWLIRLFASMIVVQIVELIAGIGWGEPNARKIIYWGMLGGDVMLVAIYAAFVHSMSEWHAVNITIVTLASVFGFLRIITLILNPRWWSWGKVAQPE